MDSRAKELLRIGNAMFSKKRQVDQLWQEIALNFYPERADFTTKRDDGAEYSDHLFTSYPPLARRELGNILASNLRPRTSRWFGIHVTDEELDEGTAERAYLEYLTDIQWRAMYDRAALLIRATKQADHDIAAFGNAVIKFGPNIEGNRLLFTNYHLRDNAWAENAEGVIDVNFRRWKPTARQLIHHFGDKVSAEVKKAFSQDPEKDFDCFHAVVPTRLYEFKTKAGKRFPYASLYIECESETVLEEVGLNYFCYVIPRWQTMSESQYGRSMATSVVLPDGRTAQVVTRVLREAGEKYVDPPMIAIMDAIRSDVALYAGGVTTADIEYDERLGEVLRPVAQNPSSMPIGFEIAQALRQDIQSGFFLDKIQLPDTSRDMTAFEVRRRIEESIRAQSPLFEPLEQEYNIPLCEGAFQVLKENGAFGAIDLMPETLRGAEIKFTFRSPISDLADQNDAETYVDLMQRIWLPAAQIDPSQLANINLTQASRDAARAGGWKAKWFNDEKQVAAAQAEQQQKQQIAETLQAVAGAGGAAQQAGAGIKAVNEAAQ